MVSILDIGDIHIGHESTSSELISSNLFLFLEKYEYKFKNLKVMVLNGDTTHKLLGSNTEEYNIFIQMMLKLLAWCDIRGVKLIATRGTDSHDMNQMKIIKTMIDNTLPHYDFLYLKEPSCLKINGLYHLFGIDFGTKPFIEVYRIFKSLLTDNNIKKFDIAHLHGHFNYQLPQVKSDNGYDEQMMLDIVRGPILINHFHTSKPNGRIIPPGSFDRLAHKEEEPKGGVLTHFDNGVYSYEFLINKNAQKYITIESDAVSVDGLDKEIYKILHRYPTAKVKFECRTSLTSGLSILRRKYPNIDIKDKEVSKKDKVVKKDNYKTYDISKDNLLDIIIERTELSKDELMLLKKHEF